MTGEPPASMSPGLVVEHFLRAANENDLDTMASLFGTREGRIVRRDMGADIESRMFALAMLLRHVEFAVVGEAVHPRPRHSAIRLNVRMVFENGVATVPFVVVRSRDGWLVEQVDTAALIGR